MTGLDFFKSFFKLYASLINAGAPCGPSQTNGGPEQGRQRCYYVFEHKMYYDMTVWILAGNYISFIIAVGLIRLHMPSVKKSCV